MEKESNDLLVCLRVSRGTTPDADGNIWKKADSEQGHTHLFTAATKLMLKNGPFVLRL